MPAHLPRVARQREAVIKARISDLKQRVLLAQRDIAVFEEEIEELEGWLARP